MITGSLVALVTPMSSDGALDFAALQRLIEWHIEQKTSGIVVAGTTGEASTLDSDEHGLLISESVGFARGRIPIIAGVGANSTKEAIHLAKVAKAAGAVGGLSVVPYYVKPTQEGMFRHFAAVAEAVDLPQILYNIPSRTVCDMNDATILRLAEIPSVVGLKDATSDMARLTEMVGRVPKSFALYSGDDQTTLAFTLLGGHGTISVTANVAPGPMSEMMCKVSSGDVADARGINAKLIPIHKSLMLETNPIPIKFLLAEMGLIGTGIRLPLTPLAEKFRSELKKQLDTWNLARPERPVQRPARQTQQA
jgi:4-hydroxy-tetrahydrodipicolinate synthase